MESAYSVDNAYKFAWSSVSGKLNPERLSHLDKYLSGKKVLDAGCSGGAYVDYLTRNGFQVTGVEKFDQFIELARERRRQGTLLEADITCLPFRDQAFDSTYCFDVLEHVDDRVALAELARVTSKRLILTVPRENDTICKFNITFLHYSDKTHLRNYTEDFRKCSHRSNTNLRIFRASRFIKNFTKEMVSSNLKALCHSNSGIDCLEA
jgi:2-polyprenyl-3-methyl-5-hydroxy-6-metoxy-1,4-benzoquinol methylase